MPKAAIVPGVTCVVIACLTAGAHIFHLDKYMAWGVAILIAVMALLVVVLEWWARRHSASGR